MAMGRGTAHAFSDRLPQWRAQPIQVDDLDIRRGGATRPWPAPQAIEHVVRYLLGELAPRAQGSPEPSVRERVDISDDPPEQTPAEVAEQVRRYTSGDVYRELVDKIKNPPPADAEAEAEAAA